MSQSGELPFDEPVSKTDLNEFKKAAQQKLRVSLGEMEDPSAKFLDALEAAVVFYIDYTEKRMLNLNNITKLNHEAQIKRFEAVSQAFITDLKGHSGGKIAESLAILINEMVQPIKMETEDTQKVFNLARISISQHSKKVIKTLKMILVICLVSTALSVGLLIGLLARA